MDELATRAVRLSRDTGTLGDLPIALTYRAGVHVHAGEFTAASALIEESNSITAATGYAPLRYASVMLPCVAGRGREGAEPLRTRQWRTQGSRGEGRTISQWGYMSAILYNGLGRYDEALDGARDSCEDDELVVRNFALVELIEAAARESSPRSPPRRCTNSRNGPSPRAPTGPSGSSLDHAHCSPPARLPTRSTSRRSNGSAEPASSCIWPGPTFCTANGSGANSDGSMAASSCEPPTTCSTGWAPMPSPSAPIASSSRNGSDSPQAHRFQAGRPDAAGSTDRPARRRRTHQPGDRQRALHQPQDRRIPPQQGVHQAWAHHPTRAPDGAQSANVDAACHLGRSGVSDGGDDSSPRTIRACSSVSYSAMSTSPSTATEPWIAHVWASISMTSAPAIVGVFLNQLLEEHQLGVRLVRAGHHLLVEAFHSERWSDGPASAAPFVCGGGRAPPAVERDPTTPYRPPGTGRASPRSGWRRAAHRRRRRGSARRARCRSRWAWGSVIFSRGS